MSNPTEASGALPRRLGSYTTARIRSGRVERLERHAGRLRRDAGRLGLPLPSRVEIERVFLETAKQAFGRGDGIIRVEWSQPPSLGVEQAPAPKLIATPRPIGSVPNRWRAASSTAIHPGPEFRANTKCVDVSAYDVGRAEVREASFDEVLLFDAAGILVEGAHSNFVVVPENGTVVTPDPALGPVEGLGLTILRESFPEIAFAELRLEDIESAREFMSVNAVRGVVPILELNGKPIGNGEPGPWTRRLSAPFSALE